MLRPPSAEALDPGNTLGSHKSGEFLSRAPSSVSQARHRAARSDTGNNVGEPASGFVRGSLRQSSRSGTPVILVAVLIAEEIVLRVGVVAAVNLTQRFIIAFNASV